MPTHFVIILLPMKRILKVITILICQLSIVNLSSCTTDSYDKGQGKYSLMQAELVDMTINADKQGTAFVTDADERFSLTPVVTASWIQTADTTYRAMLYFNVLSGNNAEPVSVGTVPTLRAREHWKIDDPKEDPIGLESAWLGKNGKYLNLGILLKTGQVDGEDGVHTIGLAQDTILVNTDGTRTAKFRFLHDQAGVPEYYTNRRFVSILLPDTVVLDTIRLTIPTYNGKTERVFLP